MKVIIIGLTYGNRPKDIIFDNLNRCGYPHEYAEVNCEGIANALNEGIDLMTGFDAIAFLANDIIEPNGWLRKKVLALNEYPNAGIVASSIHQEQTKIQSELIISNYLISRKTIETIGYFNEQMFPYGPIDLDYCDRCHAAGISTYYVMHCHATHIGDHATGNEYGWDKGKAISQTPQYSFTAGQPVYKARL